MSVWPLCFLVEIGIVIRYSKQEPLKLDCSVDYSSGLEFSLSEMSLGGCPLIPDGIKIGKKFTSRFASRGQLMQNLTGFT